MGLFWESRKEKEEREARALEAMLKAFEENPDSLKSKAPPPASAKPSLAHTPVPPSKQSEHKDLLAEFLSQKGIIDKDEWLQFKQKHQS